MKYRLKKSRDFRNLSDSEILSSKKCHGCHRAAELVRVYMIYERFSPEVCKKFFNTGYGNPFPSTTHSRSSKLMSFRLSFTSSPTRIPVEINRSIIARSRGCEHWSRSCSKCSSERVSFMILRILSKVILLELCVF